MQAKINKIALDDHMKMMIKVELARKDRTNKEEIWEKGKQKRGKGTCCSIAWS